MLLPEGHRDPTVSMVETAHVMRAPGPVALAAQTVLKSGALKKRSKQMSGLAALWQQRFVVLEGAPTHVLVYYYASAAHAAGDSTLKPRGVVPLTVRHASPHANDAPAFTPHPK